MSFQISPAVSIAVDPEVSIGQFAQALGGAGFRLQFQGGTLRVSRLKDAPAPAIGVRAKSVRASKRKGASTKRMRDTDAEMQRPPAIERLARRAGA